MIHHCENAPLIFRFLVSPDTGFWSSHEYYCEAASRNTSFIWAKVLVKNKLNETPTVLIMFIWQPNSISQVMSVPPLYHFFLLSYLWWQPIFPHLPTLAACCPPNIHIKETPALHCPLTGHSWSFMVLPDLCPSAPDIDAGKGSCAAAAWHGKSSLWLPHPSAGRQR